MEEQEETQHLELFLLASEQRQSQKHQAEELQEMASSVEMARDPR